MAQKPERLCVSCREHRDKADLLRIVLCGGEIYPDPTGKAPGRGAYVCRSGGCLQKALREGRLARSFKKAVDAEAEQRLLACWAELNQDDGPSRIWNLLGLARRGRLLVCGTQAVEIALRRGEAVLVLLAKDAADNGALPIEAKCQAEAIPCYRFGTAAELGDLTGKAVRTALAITDPSLAQGLKPLLDQENML